MENTNIEKLSVNFFEYCIIQEDTPLPAETVKVKIPKLTTSTNGGRVYPNATILVNESESKPRTSGAIFLTDCMIVKTFSGLELSKSAVVVKEKCNCTVSNHSFINGCRGNNTQFIDGHIVSAYLPKGAQMIVCFMDNNIDDGYLTNMI